MVKLTDYYDHKYQGSKVVKAYKSLTLEGKSTYQGYQWALPSDVTFDGSPINYGPTHSIHDFAPVLCQVGFHAWKNLGKAKQDGDVVWEVELSGFIVEDHEKYAAQYARLIGPKPIWQFEPILLEKGVRVCSTCREVHDRVRNSVKQGQAGTWDKDGHKYMPESWVPYFANLRPSERLEGYRTYRKELVKEWNQKNAARISAYNASYNPVVPPYHEYKPAWTLTAASYGAPNKYLTDAASDAPCKECTMPYFLHEGWELRTEIAKKYQGYDYWELMTVIVEMTKTNEKASNLLLGKEE